MDNPCTLIQYVPCMRPTFSILIENPSFLHGVHVFSVEFHGFSMGNPWYISVRVDSASNSYAKRTVIYKASILWNQLLSFLKEFSSVKYISNKLKKF